ncbi:MAG: DMT family transporter [Thermaceae bacterium]|nr:DMT family transporter [Thermaceae bacterium]
MLGNTTPTEFTTRAAIQSRVPAASSPAAPSVIVLLTSALAFTVIYAACFAAIKAGLTFAPPLMYGGLRALIGGLALLALVAALRRPLLPPRRSWPGVLLLAAVSTTIGFGAMFLSPGRTGAGIASVLGNTQPLFAVVLAAIFLKERMTFPRLVALTLGTAGATLIAYPALAGADAYGLSGAVLALAASAGTAAGSVILKRMQIKDETSPEPSRTRRGSGFGRALLVVAAWQLIIGSLPLLALSGLTERGTPVIWSAEFITLLLSLALVGTSFATALWYWLVQRVEVGRLSMFLFFVPVVGLGIAAFIVGERVGPLEVLGAALAVAGIGATVWESARRGPSSRGA